MRIVEDRGSLVGAVVVNEGDEVMAVTAAGGVIRTPITEDALRFTSRDTMGVRLMNLSKGDTVVAVATNAERADADDEGVADVPGPTPDGEQGPQT
jgi:DNA gyrase subunit A